MDIDFSLVSARVLADALAVERDRRIGLAACGGASFGGSGSAPGASGLFVRFRGF
jgi:hypothetical protein